MLMNVKCCWSTEIYGNSDVRNVAVQVASTTTGVGALIPQILLNLKQGNSGEWSPLTAGLSTAGNAVRVFTTVQLTQDPLLLAGFSLGFLVNGALFAQILYYGAQSKQAAE